MTKIKKRFGSVVLGLLMALGVGVSLASIHGQTIQANAANDMSSYTLLTTSNISSLTTDDMVVVCTKDGSSGVTGYSSKDATVSGTISDWINFTVTNVDASNQTYALKNSNTNKWISSNADNKFTIAATSPTNMTADENGYLKYKDSNDNMRYLVKIGNYYRCYKAASITGTYEYFYAYIVSRDVLALKSISVKNATSNYYEGAVFSPEGLVITQNFNDGTTKDIIYSEDTKDKFTFSPNLATKLTTDTKTINISYKDDEYGTKNVDLPIVVSADEIVSISIDDSSFEGKTFGLNGKWSTNGIIVKATRASGSVTILDNSDSNLTFVFSPEKPNSLTLSSVEVTVTYDGTFGVTKELTGFNVVEQIECTYDFVTNFDTYTASGWKNDSGNVFYGEHTLSEEDLGSAVPASITLDASKQTSTITDRPVFKGSENQVVIDFKLNKVGFKVSYVEIEFAKWNNKTPTFKLYEGAYDSSSTSISSLTIAADSTNLTLSGDLDTDHFQVVTSGGNQAGLTSISIVVVEDIAASNAANVWGKAFLENTASACVDQDADNSSALVSVWPTLENEYAVLSETTKKIIVGAVANESGSDLEEAVARYDHIIVRYSSLDNFIGRTLTTSSLNRFVNRNESRDLTAFIAFASIVGIASIGGLFLIRKRRRASR